MKVLLLNPPVKNMIRTILPEGVEKNRGYSPPLGLLYLAASLRHEEIADVEVLDAQAEELDYTQLRKRMAYSRPDLVGISAMTFTLPDVLKCVDISKNLFPDVPIVMGGPHINLYPGITLRHHPAIDYVLKGEAERTFPLLVRVLNGAGTLQAVSGLVYRSNGEIVEQGAGDWIERLEELPFPARDLLDLSRYTSVLSSARKVTTMITSRGCPYRCTFCYRAPYDYRFRPRPSGNVVDEMAACLELGIEEVFIYDDTFNLQRERVIAICRELLQRALPMGWDARCRVDLLDTELLDWMCRAGCRRLHLGVESGSPRVLQQCRKGIRLDQVRDGFKMARRAGIDTLAYFMIGFPDETEEEILETIRLALSLPSQYTQFAIVIPFPGTELYETERASGDCAGDPWAEFVATPKSDFLPPRCHGTVSTEHLEKLFQQAYRAYYRRPSYLFKSLARIRSWEELLSKGKVGWKILWTHRSQK